MFVASNTWSGRPAVFFFFLIVDADDDAAIDRFFCTAALIRSSKPGSTAILRVDVLSAVCSE